MEVSTARRIARQRGAHMQWGVPCPTDCPSIPSSQSQTGRMTACRTVAVPGLCCTRMCHCCSVPRTSCGTRPGSRPQAPARCTAKRRRTKEASGSSGVPGLALLQIGKNLLPLHAFLRGMKPCRCMQRPSFKVQCAGSPESIGAFAASQLHPPTGTRRQQQPLQPHHGAVAALREDEATQIQTGHGLVDCSGAI